MRLPERMQLPGKFALVGLIFLASPGLTFGMVQAQLQLLAARSTLRMNSGGSGWRAHRIRLNMGCVT